MTDTGMSDSCRAKRLPAICQIIVRRGDRDAAIAILGSLALDPDSTLAAEYLAKAVLALLVAGS
jgi:hypothetical protein